MIVYRVRGYCPMGCGETLICDPNGMVSCTNLTCPRPATVIDLLADREHEHIVRLGEKSFTIRHPLRERLDDALLRCELHARLAITPGPPCDPGTYRVVMSPTAYDGWHWTRLEKAVVK